MAEQALEKDLKEEAEFLARYDLIYRAIDSRYDVRGKDLNVLVLSCMEQNGKLSINRRKKFADTVPVEVFEAIEAEYLKARWLGFSKADCTNAVALAVPLVQTGQDVARN